MENGNCSDICHDNLSPRANGTCGCDGYCLTCPNKSTSCETCDSTSSYSYLYNKQCKSSCPNHTYENDVGKICIDCKQGCDNCS
jgi:proprotein convertase subtilisin/kexin type 5